MPIDNLNSLEANKQDYPDIIPPDDPTYYLSSAEWNKLIQTLKILINDYNANVANLGGGVSLPLITSTDTITEPTDSNIFSAARTLNEILSVLSGYDDYYLSKRFNDVSTGKITFNKGLQLGTYEPNIRGGNIDQGGNAELNSLRLRQWLEVPELRYNRVEIQMGDKWRSPGGGIIESVDTVNKIVTLKLEEGEYGAVAVNDLCMGIFHSTIPSNNATSTIDDGKNNRTIEGFATSYFKITELLNPSENNSRFRYELRPTSINFSKQVEPEPFMNFAVFGNTTNTERQSSAYETRTYQRFLINMNNWESTQFNVAAQFGDLSNLNNLGLTGLSGYSVYLNNVYFTGTIQQMKSPRIEYGTWWTWDGTKWIDSGVPATGQPKDGLYYTLLNNSLNIQSIDPTYEHTWAELHVYEGNKQLNYVSTPPLTIRGTYTVNILATGVTPGSLVPVTVSSITFLKTTPILAMAPEARTGNILFNISGLRTDGTAFSFSISQVFTKVDSGKDGKDIEYVYTRTQNDTPPLAPTESQNIDNFVPAGWTADPVGVDDYWEYEWYVKREKIDNIWSAWGNVLQWRYHAADGHDGKDGSTREYIYRANNDAGFAIEANRPTDSPEFTDEYVPDGWTDEPVDPDPTMQYEWYCYRDKTGGLGAGVVPGKWGAWNGPYLWSRYGKDGTGGDGSSVEIEYSITGTSNWHSTYTVGDIYMRQRVGDSAWSAAIKIVGEDGTDGPYTDYTFAKNNDPDVAPSPIATWTDAPPALLAGEHLWMRSRKVTPPDPPGEWSVPVRMTGKEGAPGIQGPPGVGVPIVFRGEYVDSARYYGSTTRIDIVKYTTDTTTAYYRTKETVGMEGIVGIVPTNTTFWDHFGESFESVATELLLAENANIAGFAFRDLTMQSQMGIAPNGTEINLGLLNPIPDDLVFIPNLKLDGVKGNISIRDKIKLFSDGSGYLANNNLRWDSSGNLLIGNNQIGKDGDTGGTLLTEFSATGEGNWHTLYAQSDRFMRKKIGNGLWSEPIEVVKNTEYNFAKNSSNTTPPASDSTDWQIVPRELLVGEYMWIRSRNITHNSTPPDTYSEWTTPTLATQENTEFSLNGKINWKSTYSTGDLFMRVKSGSAWGKAVKIGLDVEYQFANNTSSTTAPTTWYDTPYALTTTGQHMWMQYRTITYSQSPPAPPSLPYTAGTWSTPSRITGVNGYSTTAKYSTIGFNTDGSGYLASGNISWDVLGNTNIVGTIHATSGDIGGFSISDYRLGKLQSGNDPVYNGMSLYNDFIKFSNSQSAVFVGTNVLPATSGTTALARFESTYVDDLKKYGLIINISGANSYFGGNNNVAISIEKGVIDRVRWQIRAKNASSGSHIFTDETEVVLYLSNSDYYVVLPLYPEVGEVKIVTRINAYNLQVRGNGNEILEYSSNATSTSIFFGPDYTIKARTLIFRWDGTYWIMNTWS